MSRYVLINMNSHPVDVDLKSGYPPVRIQPGVDKAFKLGEVSDSELPGLQALRRINLVVRKEPSVTPEAPAETSKPTETQGTDGKDDSEPQGTPDGQETPKPTETQDGQSTETSECEGEAQGSEETEPTDTTPTKESLLAGREAESLTNDELKSIVNALGLPIEGKLTRAKAIEAIKGA